MKVQLNKSNDYRSDLYLFNDAIVDQWIAFAKSIGGELNVQVSIKQYHLQVVFEQGNFSYSITSFRKQQRRGSAITYITTEYKSLSVLTIRPINSPSIKKTWLRSKIEAVSEFFAPMEFLTNDLKYTITQSVDSSIKGSLNHMGHMLNRLGVSRVQAKGVLELEIKTDRFLETQAELQILFDLASLSFSMKVKGAGASYTLLHSDSHILKLKNVFEVKRRLVFQWVLTKGLNYALVALVFYGPFIVVSIFLHVMSNLDHEGVNRFLTYHRADLMFYSIAGIVSFGYTARLWHKFGFDKDIRDK